ncbi:MAG: nicotinate-nucleotide adenylyltransferase [Nitrospinota bacterium]|nr:nicotinate-nucleotide adenylyltransferase [Nitrospinota bacterium]
MRTGVLGGTFNPIHFGHLHPAEEVRQALGLGQVRFVPLALPAHKDNGDIAPPEDRLEMVRLALEERPGFICDAIEIERGGVSYTVDTLSALAEGACRGHELFFIIGADAFSLLHTWREPLTLLKMVNFAVTLRGEQRAERVREAVERGLRGIGAAVTFTKIRDNRFQLIESNKITEFVSVETMDISATRIREIVLEGGGLQNLLPPSVEAFIIRRGLYGRPV